MQLRRGWLGTVTLQESRYTVELHGLHDLLQQEIGAVYMAECRHDLGDALCGVNLATYTVTGSVTGVGDASVFFDAAQSGVDGWFSYGKLQWLSGVNSGLAMEVKQWDAATKQMTLWLPMPAVPQVGDSYMVYAGCDKRFATCKAKFSNGVNFGGFPQMPGVDRILQYPDSKA